MTAAELAVCLGAPFTMGVRRLMTLSYTIDVARNLVVITGEYGDAQEWERVLNLIADDPRLRPNCYVLRDQRAATKMVDAATVVLIMDMVRKLWSRLGVRRGAIVMPRALDPPALVAHAIADADKLPIQAFTSYDAAMEWLLGSGSDTDASERKAQRSKPGAQGA